jgi:hypothetical protein
MNKKSKNMYWGEEQDNAIVEFLAIENLDERSIFFYQHLYCPVKTMVESIVHRFKNQDYSDLSIDDIIKDTISYAVGVLPKINMEKGKAFSYLSVSIKNYLIQMNMKGYNRYKRYISMDENEDSPTSHSKFSMDDDYDTISSRESEIRDNIIKFWEENPKYMEFRRVRNPVDILVDFNSLGVLAESKRDIYSIISMDDSPSDHASLLIINRFARINHCLRKWFSDHGNLELSIELENYLRTNVEEKITAINLGRTRKVIKSSKKRYSH